MEIIDPGFPDTPEKVCEHAPDVAAEPRAAQCEECGSSFNLRSCMNCGHVGCCESQAGHARAHALTEHHPVIEQITGHGPGFAWCYDERRYVRSHV
jgi:uncharacterized UBP type Zn finger protein